MTTEQAVQVAVALKWEGDSAPRVSAKGRGELAQRIADLADEHDVMINEDAALVEVLAQVEVGQEIPQALFVAVAEIIAFAYSLRSELPEHVVRSIDPAAPG